MKEWHFPRKSLAEHYLELLNIGISSSLAIIAPRRKGKTLFVLRDLAPLAQKKGYIPIYASLWQNINSPHVGIISALEESLEALEKRGMIGRILNAEIKKTSLSNEFIGKMELEFAEQAEQAESDQLVLIESLIGKLEKKAGKKKLLLIIDEIQHLATSKKFESLSHALRTSLDKRQGRIKSIFTGSSRHYMNLLFNDSQSPFYHFVEAVTFPDLDEKFTEHLYKILKKDYKVEVNLSALDVAFEKIDKSPYWMMKIISHMLTNKSDVDVAQQYVSRVIIEAEGYESIAKNMREIDKMVYLALCEGESPFSKEILDSIDKQTPVKGVPANVQRAIKRLSDRHLISQINKGEYYIEKPGLKDYLMNVD